MLIYWRDLSALAVESQWDDVTRILLTVSRQQHHVRFEDWPAFQASAYVAEYGKVCTWRARFELLESLATADLTSALTDRVTDLLAGPTGVFVAIGQVENASFVLAWSQAASWLERPLIVWLENQSDKVIVEVPATEYRSSKVTEAIQKDWLEFRGCGGSGEVKKRVAEACKSAPQVRGIAIADSDRLAPGQPSKEAKAIQALLGDRAWVLQKREKENYLPPQHLKRQQTSGETARVKKYAALGPDGAQFVDVRSTLGGRICDHALDRFAQCNSTELDSWNGDELRRLLVRIEKWL